MTNAINSTNTLFVQSQISKQSEAISTSAESISSTKNADATTVENALALSFARDGVLREALISNAEQATSLLNTASDALGNVLDQLTSILQTTVQGTNDALSDGDRASLQQILSAQLSGIERVAQGTDYNGINLLDGSISGEASLTSASGETIENNTLLAVTDLRLGGVVASGDLDSDASAVTGFDAVSFTASANVGTSATSNILNFVQGAAGGASIVEVGDVAINFTAVAADSAATATAFVEAVRAHQVANDDATRGVVFVDNGNGTVTTTAVDYGTGSDTLEFGGGTSTGTNLTFFVGSSADVLAAGAVLNSNGPISQGAVRGNTGTINETLLGGISNISATISSEGDSVFSATFTAEVNGETYRSQPVYLLDDGTGNGYEIQADQVITFEDPNGPVDTNGILTDNSFNLVVDSDTSIAGTNIATLQDSISSFATNLETQLVGASFTQDRNPNLAVVSAINNTLEGSLGTFLNGIEGYDVANNAKGDVIFRTDAYGSDAEGSIGSVGAFSFDRDTGVLSTTIDGVTYSANLTNDLAVDAEQADGNGYIVDSNGDTDNGVGYDTSTGTFSVRDANSESTIVLKTSDITDGRELRIDLTNVNADSFDVLGQDGENAFVNAFNSLFGVAENGALSFQVGTDSADTIDVSIASISSSDIFVDDNGAAASLSVATTEDAQAATDAVTRAIDIVSSAKTDVDSAITQFADAIDINAIGAQNSSASQSLFEDADIADEASKLAAATVARQAGLAVLAQVNQLTQSLIQLLN